MADFRNAAKRKLLQMNKGRDVKSVGGKPSQTGGKGKGAVDFGNGLRVHGNPEKVK